jgi:ATP-dependent Lhr-like helicase
VSRESTARKGHAEAASEGALGLFHPRIREYFREAFGAPTDIQEKAWPAIAAGRNVLVSAPTGSGKTLTAFLWALDRLFTGVWPSGSIQVLYISPLKALNTDIRKNLERPLQGIFSAFERAGERVPLPRAMTRSGDTTEEERRKMLRHPPEILITTPETLNVLLTSKRGRLLLADVRAVILDEVHAVAGTKRGTHLFTAVERLTSLAGELQRIALSATVEPMSRVAELVGGFRLEYRAGEAHYLPRPVELVASAASKTYDLKVRFPADPATDYDDDALWDLLARDIRRVIGTNRSTLVFANSRRTTERATRLINQGHGEDLAYPHHGSLSREVRSVIEERLKKGQLKAIVATNSLELGIDIGELDQVLLLQAPRSFASAIQRVGRAGHGVGQVSRGVIYPMHGRDFLDAAVVSRAVIERRVEDVEIPMAPLDVLAQVLLSMCCFETWTIDELYDAIRTTYSYRRLSRRHFDLTIDMLAGRYADSRIRELRPRVLIDKVRGTITARSGTERLLYLSGGTIFDRGYYTLRHADTGGQIGQLDEEFVWERLVGDAFTLGAQSWQVKRITHNDVLVVPARGAAAAMSPFWRADAEDRGFPLCQEIGAFLEKADGRLADPELVRELETRHGFEPGAVEALLHYLNHQASATGGKLPRRDRLMVERSSDVTQGSGYERLFLFTFWGGTVNRPLAMALGAAWEERYGEAPEIMHDDYCLMLRLPEGTRVEDIFELVPAARVETLLRRRLESTGFFGARFRINASTALLLPRSGFNHRTPLWLSRERAKKLHEAVAESGDFPLVIETWRTCLQDDMAIEQLKVQLDLVQSGALPYVEVRTDKPSPLAGGIVWMTTNRLMYETDRPDHRRGGLRQDLLQELVYASELRPRLPAALSERLRQKLQRVAPGYAPRPGDELRLWIEERQLLTLKEWRELAAAVERDHGEPVEESGLRLVWTRLPGAILDVATTDEVLERIERARGEDGTDEDWDEAGERGEGSAEGAGIAGRIAEWLRFYAVVAPSFVVEAWGLPHEQARDVFDGLVESRAIVVDRLLAGSEDPEICDAQNLEILLRWLRQAQRPAFEAVEASWLPLFLAGQQGLCPRGDGLEPLQENLEKLFGYPLSAGLWESEILPARLAPYYPSWLDSLMQESELIWVGAGKEKLTFGFPSDLELLFAQDAGGEISAEDEELLAELFANGQGPADLLELAARVRRPVDEVNDGLWRLAWSGRVSNEAFVAVRKGLLNHFQPLETRVDSRRLPRRGSGWKPSRPSVGDWFPLETRAGELDALEREELVKDRVRLLLGRWGLLCRELLQRELPAMQWSRVFRTLRLMELSGEVVAGVFFQGLSGLQFMAPGAFRQLERGLPEDLVYWVNAADPASLCGVEVEGLKAELPSRLATSHLVYHGRQLVLVSRKKAKELEIKVPADHPRLLDYFEVLRHLLGREFDPQSSLTLERINGENAAQSPYLRKMENLFQVTREGHEARLWRTYGGS